MEKDNKETIVDIITGVMVIVGIYTNNKYVLFSTIIPICISIGNWYSRNLSEPIVKLELKTEELSKDLNTRKEIENIKIQIMELKMKESKKAALNPLLLICILVVIIMIMMYLRDKGFI